MSQVVEDKQRRVIPRWRDVRTASKLKELGSINTCSKRPNISQDSFTEKVDAWANDHTVAAAADLIGAAQVFGREPEAVEAARFLVDQADRLENAPALVSCANALLIQSDPSHGQTFEDIVPLSRRHSQNRIHNLRVRLHKDPRNSLTWVDLSREYAINGLLQKADAAMMAALSLVPDNRFILRSAARLYVHRDEPDRAYELLRRQRITQRDPWLLSVEISVASIAGKTSRHIKDGRLQVKDQSFSPFDTSELASALATIEFSAGDSKQARRLFRQSLVEPTDNAVGQASWASRHLSGFDLDPAYLQIPLSYEARGWTAYTKADWKAALTNYENWLFDQPFSSWPATCGSSLAGIVLGDYEKSAQFTEIGLRANPTDAPLLNNHAVAMALLGRVKEAEDLLGRINLTDLNLTTRITSTATRGLVAFRQGDSINGRRWYESAIRLADENNQHRLKSLARIMLAQEEIRIRSDHSRIAFKAALSEFDKVRDRDYVPLIERVSRDLATLSKPVPKAVLPDGREFILGRR